MIGIFNLTLPKVVLEFGILKWVVYCDSPSDASFDE